MPPDPVTDIVSRRMPENLSRQSGDDRVQWRVLMVDNASTDNTAEVVTRHRRKARLPDLRYVFEAAPGTWACFALGFARGARRCERIAEPRRAKLLDAAALPYRDDSRSRLSA